MTWNGWLAHNVTLNAERWREKDKGKWQKKIHDAMRAATKRPWIDKPIVDPASPAAYGMKSL